MACNVNPRFVSMIALGFGFMFTFTAFQTMEIIEQTILNSVQEEDPNFKGDGFTSLAIVYAVFSLAILFVHSLIAVIGPNLSMILGGFCYVHFIVSFLYPSDIWLYIASVFVGLGAAAIWIGQDNYLTVIYGPENMSRNRVIFWTQLQCSLLFGNLFVYFMFGDEIIIPKDTRNVVLIVLSVVCGIGVVILGLLRRVPKYGFDDTGNPREAPVTAAAAIRWQTTAMGALKDAFDLFLTPEMLLLSVTFFYMGIELSFLSGVYSTCVGNTLVLPNSKALVGMSGMLIGVGEIVAGTMVASWGKASTCHGCNVVVLYGCLMNIISFFSVFLNLSDDCVFGNTDITGSAMYSTVLVLYTSFTLGFGDACFSTQVYAIIGDVCCEQSSAGFALFKCVQSLSAAISFFYSPYVSLYYQLLILAIFSVLGTVAFLLVELGLRRTSAAAGRFGRRCRQLTAGLLIVGLLWARTYSGAVRTRHPPDTAH